MTIFPQALERLTAKTRGGGGGGGDKVSECMRDQRARGINTHVHTQQTHYHGIGADTYTKSISAARG